MENTFSIGGYDNDLEGVIYSLAIMFSIKYLKIPKNILISVEFDELADGLNGYVIEQEHNHFDIAIEKRGRLIQQNIMTIFHEMTHVKQHIFENLSELLDSPDKPEYSERWWEIEAFSESVKMVDAFTLFLTEHKEVDMYELRKHI